MNDFLQDILHDLREKRLWPVAAVLALAVLVVPVLLLKGSDPQSGAKNEPAAAPASGAVSAIAQPVGDGAGGSDLGSFDSKNPFKPGVKKRKATSGESTIASGSLGGGAVGTTPGSTGDGGGVTPPTDTTPPTTRKRTISYTYVADVTFGRVGRTRNYRSLKKLEMLPNENSPLLVFLGATSSGDDAVFLVDQSLDQAGEGDCADNACSMLSLGAGSEHRFTDQQGNTYLLRVNEIRKTRSARSAKAARARKARKAARARASVGEKSDDRASAARGFISALLSDLQTSTGADAGASSPAGEGR